MAFEVTRVKRLNSKYVNVYYDVWIDGCKPCSLIPKVRLIESQVDISSEEAREIIREGLHIWPRSI